MREYLVVALSCHRESRQVHWAGSPAASTNGKRKPSFTLAALVEAKKRRRTSNVGISRVQSKSRVIGRRHRMEAGTRAQASAGRNIVSRWTSQIWNAWQQGINPSCGEEKSSKSSIGPSRPVERGWYLGALMTEVVLRRRVHSQGRSKSK